MQLIIVIMNMVHRVPEVLCTSYVGLGPGEFCQILSGGPQSLFWDRAQPEHCESTGSFSPSHHQQTSDSNLDILFLRCQSVKL